MNQTFRELLAPFRPKSCDCPIKSCGCDECSRCGEYAAQNQDGEKTLCECCINEIAQDKADREFDEKCAMGMI